MDESADESEEEDDDSDEYSSSLGDVCPADVGGVGDELVVSR